MSDIARSVGVSRTAVSFVLNGCAREKGISRKMEARVLQAAKDLNYRPSLIARSLVTNKSMSIGLILPNMSVTYGPLLAENIEVGALDEGYQVLLCHHGDNEKRLQDICRLMTSRRADGLILVPPVGIKRSEVFEELLDQNIPLIFVERDPNDERVNFVSTDSALSARLAVEHLLNLGHRHVAFFNSAPSLIASRQREQAYIEALARFHHPFDPELIVFADIDGDDDSDRCFEQVINHRPRPTALVTVSAERAMAVYHAARKRDLSFPADLSLVVISGYRFTPFHKLQPTQVRLPYEAVGETALRILLEEMRRKKKAPKQRVMVGPELQMGHTSAPPRRSHA